MTMSFISPGIDLAADDENYRHFATLDRQAIVARWSTPEGQSILNNLIANEFNRAVIEASIGRILGKYDMRGIPLPKTKLRQANLVECDLFTANLSGADL